MLSHTSSRHGTPSPRPPRHAVAATLDKDAVSRTRGENVQFAASTCVRAVQIGHWLRLLRGVACSVDSGSNVQQCGCSRRVYARGACALGNQSRQCVQAAAATRARPPGSPTHVVWLQRLSKRAKHGCTLAFLDTLASTSRLAFGFNRSGRAPQSSQQARRRLDAIAETQPNSLRDRGWSRDLNPKAATRCSLCGRRGPSGPP